MDFKTIKDMIVSTVGRNSPELLNYVGSFVNNRQRRICSAKNWWFLRATQTFNTVVDVNEYNLPIDYKDDFLFYWRDLTTNNIKYIPIGSEVEALNVFGITGKGYPRIMILTPTTIKTFPTPDKVCEINFLYYRFLNDLVNDTDNNTLTNEMPDILIAGGVADAYAFLQEYNDAAFWENKFNAFYRELNFRNNERILPSDLMLVPKGGKFETSFDEKWLGRIISGWY